MTHAQDRPANQALDTRILSAFIYELNIARRQLALYPSGHPQILASSGAALAELEKLCAYRDAITFGIARDSLLFEDSWLTGEDPVYRDLAGYLFSREIASITFKPGLDAQELARFHHFLDAKPVENHSGALPDRLREQEIHHVEVQTVAYGSFQAAAPDSPASGDTPGGAQLWEDFLKGLLHEQLDADGRTLPAADRLDPLQVAELINQTARRHPGKPIDYDQVISAFIAQLQTANSANAAVTAQQLESLINHLNPDLRQSFLNSTLRALDRNPEQDSELLGSLSADFISETLQQVNAEQLNLSSRLLDLLGKISGSSATGSTWRTAGDDVPLPDEALQARTEILLLEDRHDEYVPGDYQQILQEILQDRVTGSLPAPTAQALLNDLATFPVERQCSRILFNMLDNRVDLETEQQVQDNLVELSRFFLDTGDFQGLREIYSNWSEYLFSGRTHARFLDERVLGSQTSETFMNEVLDSLAVWGESKFHEAAAYLQEVGEPYAELLIERLGTADQTPGRTTWIRLLAALGTKGQALIQHALRDHRWHLVRDLLQVFERREQDLPVKEVHQLAATHPHPQVREQALRMLFRCNPATANRLLLRELSAGQNTALQVLVPVAVLSGNDHVLEQLHRLLEAAEPDDPELKKSLLETLAEIGSPRTIPVLARLLKKKGLLRSRRRKQFQLDLIQTLGRYPAAAAEPLLNSLIACGDREQSRLAQQQRISDRSAS